MLEGDIRQVSWIDESLSKPGSRVDEGIGPTKALIELVEARKHSPASRLKTRGNMDSLIDL